MGFSMGTSGLGDSWRLTSPNIFESHSDVYTDCPRHESDCQLGNTAMALEDLGETPDTGNRIREEDAESWTFCTFFQKKFLLRERNLWALYWEKDPTETASGPDLSQGLWKWVLDLSGSTVILNLREEGWWRKDKSRERERERGDLSQKPHHHHHPAVANMARRSKPTGTWATVCFHMESSHALSLQWPGWNTW